MIVLTEVEIVAAEQWRVSGEYTTFEIAAKILASRYPAEYRMLREAVVGI